MIEVDWEGRGDVRAAALLPYSPLFYRMMLSKKLFKGAETLRDYHSLVDQSIDRSGGE